MISFLVLKIYMLSILFPKIKKDLYLHWQPMPHQHIIDFFSPRGITSLATHATSTYYWFFGKIYLKPKISLYLMDWAHMVREILTLRGRFMVHISSSSIWIITYDIININIWVELKQNSRRILPLLHSWQATSSTRAHIYTKWQQNPRYVISSSAYDPCS